LDPNFSPFIWVRDFLSKLTRFLFPTVYLVKLVSLPKQGVRKFLNIISSLYVIWAMFCPLLWTYFQA